jgi:hypothetical protein
MRASRVGHANKLNIYRLIPPHRDYFYVLSLKHEPPGLKNLMSSGLGCSICVECPEPHPSATPPISPQSRPPELILDESRINTGKQRKNKKEKEKKKRERKKTNPIPREPA